MEIVAFRKGQCLASKAREALAEGIEPTLNMVGFPFFLADHVVTLRVKDVRVGLPTITEGGTADIIGGNASPQLQRAGLTPIPDPVRHHLSRSATQRQPQPALLRLAAHKRP